MTQSPIPQTTDDERQLENARVGYQVAAGLRTSRADELWSQFNAFVTAHSIILAAAVIALSSSQPVVVLSLGMPIVGLFLCALWSILYARGVGYVLYYGRSARELEEQYLSDPVRTLSRGGDYAHGAEIKFSRGGDSKSLQINPIGRTTRVRTVSYGVIAVFACMYIAIFFWELLAR